MGNSVGLTMQRAAGHRLFFFSLTSTEKFQSQSKHSKVLPSRKEYKKNPFEMENSSKGLELN